MSCICLIMSVDADSGVYHQLEYDFNEEQPAGAIVGNVRNDARLGLDVLDSDVLSSVRFTQRQRNPFFDVDETSGDIASTRRIDRELLCPYVVVCEQVLEVTVTPLTLFQLVRVIVNVVDINDHDPVFPTDWLTLDVIETTKIGSTFSLPEAEDADSQPLSVGGYRLLDGSSTFELETSGRGDGSHEVRVRLTRAVDRETRDYYALMLFAVDGGQPQRSASMHIDVLSAMKSPSPHDAVPDGVQSHPTLTSSSATPTTTPPRSTAPSTPPESTRTSRSALRCSA